MQIAQFFKRVETVAPAALRDLLGAHAPEEYQLVDVGGVFGLLAAAERRHLGRLAARFEQLTGAGGGAAAGGAA